MSLHDHREFANYYNVASCGYVKMNYSLLPDCLTFLLVRTFLCWVSGSHFPCYLFTLWQIFLYEHNVLAIIPDNSGDVGAQIEKNE